MLINISITSERHFPLVLNYVKSNEDESEGERRRMVTRVWRGERETGRKGMLVIKEKSRMTTVKNNELPISQLLAKSISPVSLQCKMRNRGNWALWILTSWCADWPHMNISSCRR
jgi:hypothetical protein